MRRPSGGPDLLFSLLALAAIAAESRRANYLSRGVFVPRGEHRVRFRYRPRSFLIGIGVSLAFLLAASGAIPVLQGTEAQRALAWRIYEQ
jgi:hypothetical protein